MTNAIDVQGVLIRVGLLVAVGVFVYAIAIDETIAGVETVTVMMWVFAATFAALALSHAVLGRYDLAGGHGGAAAGWLFVLLGSGTQVLLGVLILVLSGVYVALVTLRLRGEPAE